MTNIEVRTQNIYENLSNAEKKVASYFLDNVENVFAKPISQLAERTGSANSTVSGIVDRLEKLELAKRTRSDADRRVIYVEATPRYNEMRVKVQTGVDEYFDGLLDTLEPGEREAIGHALELLDRALTEERTSAEG